MCSDVLKCIKVLKQIYKNIYYFKTFMILIIFLMSINSVCKMLQQILSRRWRLCHCDGKIPPHTAKKRRDKCISIAMFHIILNRGNHFHPYAKNMSESIFKKRKSLSESKYEKEKIGLRCIRVFRPYVQLCLEDWAVRWIRWWKNGVVTQDDRLSSTKVFS